MTIWRLRNWMLLFTVLMPTLGLAACGPAGEEPASEPAGDEAPEAPVELTEVSVFDGRLQASLPCVPEPTEPDTETTVLTAICKTEAAQVEALFRPGDGEGTYDLDVGTTRMLEHIGDYMESLGGQNLSVDSGDIEIEGLPAVQAHVKAGIEPGNLKARLFMISDGNNAWGVWLLYRQGSELDDMTAEIRNSIEVSAESVEAGDADATEADAGESV